MCLAIPVKIISVEGEFAEIDFGGVRRVISTMLTPDVGEGDYVLVHAGCAIQKLAEEDARERIGLIKEMFEGPLTMDY